MMQVKREGVHSCVGISDVVASENLNSLLFSWYIIWQTGAKAATPAK